NPMEEAQALQGLRDTLSITQEELATRLGKSRPAISNALRLLQLSPNAQQDVREGRLSAGHARCLLGIGDPQQAEALRQAILEQNLTVRQAEEAVAFWRRRGVLPWDELGNAQAREENPPRPAKGKGQKIPQLQHIENSLTQSLACKAALSGNLQKGRITLKYTSQDNLRHILHSLGLELPDTQ
ncbi:MAG: chromosome partitioning protein ParB, partial [Desulfovibrionaceae bacterium]|nr:chromosome partitioning protein ParB [Desulfovibrionaceae bacterium]